MEQLSPASSVAPALVLEGQLRECFGRVVYSHKTHEKCADILQTRNARVKVAQIVLSALTTGGLVVAILGEQRAAIVVGAVLSTVLLVLNAYLKNYDLGELAQKHRQAGSDLWLVREKYLSLLTDLRTSSATLPEVLKQRDALVEELHRVYSGAPSTSIAAYRKAQEALQRLEDMTFSDAEVDAFLPKELKRGSGPQSVVKGE